MRFISEQKLLTCPYNESHHVTEARFNQHIEKCRRNLQRIINAQFNEPDVDFSSKNQIDECPYSAQKCETIIDPCKLFGTVPLTECQNEVLPPSDENWDTEYKTGGTYNPYANTENSCIIRTMTGGTRSQKRKYRRNERMRVLAIKTSLISLSNDVKTRREYERKLCLQLQSVCLGPMLRKLMEMKFEKLILA